MFVARGSSVRPPGWLDGLTAGRTTRRPNGRTAHLTAPDGPPNGPAPTVQPNQTKNNDTPTIASLGYTGRSYISDNHQSSSMMTKK